MGVVGHLPWGLPETTKLVLEGRVQPANAAATPLPGALGDGSLLGRNGWPWRPLAFLRHGRGVNPRGARDRTWPNAEVGGKRHA